MYAVITTHKISRKQRNWVYDFICQRFTKALPSRHIFNINIPDVAELKGAQVTLTKVVVANLSQLPHKLTARGQVFWIGLSGEAVAEPKKGVFGIESDFFAVANGFVSITPIQMDATNYDILMDLHTKFSQKQ